MRRRGGGTKSLTAGNVARAPHQAAAVVGAALAAPATQHWLGAVGPGVSPLCVLVLRVLVLDQCSALAAR